MDTVPTTNQILVFLNSKPWMTRGIRVLLKACNTSFRSGNAQQYSIARSELKRGIRAYRRRIEGHFKNSDPRQLGPT